MAELGLKAAISSLSGLEAIIQGMRVEQLLGRGELPETSIAQAEQHVRTGLSLLKAAIEGRDDGT